MGHAAVDIAMNNAAIDIDLILRDSGCIHSG